MCDGMYGQVVGHAVDVYDDGDDDDGNNINNNIIDDDNESPRCSLFYTVSMYFIYDCIISFDDRVWTIVESSCYILGII
jgi:hypothetical protein